MSSKHMAGVIALVVGIVLIIFSIHSMRRIAEAKSGVHSLSQTFSDSSSGKKAGNLLQGKATQYDIPVMIILIGGIILTVIGGSVVLLSKKKRR